MQARPTGDLDVAEAGVLAAAGEVGARVVERIELVLARLDRRDEALELAHQEVALARRWGGPRALGDALEAAAPPAPGSAPSPPPNCASPAWPPSMTNREGAQALFVIPKTVEYHLSHAYQKLGLRSRSQLAAALRSPG